MTACVTNPARRTVLGAFPAIASLALFGIGHAAAAESLDLSSPESRLRAFRQMRGSLDDRLVIGCVLGHYYGVIDSEPTPLFGVAAATFSRYRSLPDGDVLVVSFEQAYYTDVATGLVLDQWTNPYNGQVCKPPIVRSEAASRVLTRQMVFTGPPIKGAEIDQRVLPPEREAGDVIFVEQVKAKATIPGMSRPYRYSEMVSCRARSADFADRSAMRVPTTTAFTNISDWRGWMRMGEQPGVLVAHGSGMYGAELGQLPAVWLDAVRKSHPELLDDPGKPLAAMWNS